MGKYESGEKVNIICKMATFAIRDQMALIDALTPRFGEPDTGTKAAIIDAEKCIRDFQRLCGEMVKDSTNISISCGSCRKSKPGNLNGRDGLYSCKHRDSGKSFYIFDAEPCENWLPSKSDIKIWIERSKAKSTL